MNLRRCPSCRTLRGAEEGSRCVGCGGELPKLPPESEDPPAVAQEGKRDRKRTSKLLVGFGFLGIAGAFKFGSGNLLLLSLAAALVGIFAAIARSLPKNPADAAALRYENATAGCLCFLALLGGLAILLLFACTHFDLIE